jgi:S-adenosyl-L-methionine hydrolase (adenosine-forming)
VIVTLLTDYGRDDEFVGVCHGVIRTICPGCEVIDLTHGIPRHDVRRGAVVLGNALPYTPPGVHVAVVDPEVGTERRAIAVRCEENRLLVGPDNGLLSLAWERFAGAAEAFDVSRSPHRLEPVSATFHGRDVFCAVAAQLARGAELGDAGDRVDPGELVTLELPAPRVESGLVSAHVLLVDRFGNVALNLRHEALAGSGLTLGAAVEVEVGGARHAARFARSFADVAPGEMLVYEDAYRMLAIAVNRGDAASAIGAGPDDEVRLTPP